MSFEKLIKRLGDSKSEEIKRIKESYEAKIQRLMDEKARFVSLMAVPDQVLRTKLGNHEDDLVYQTTDDESLKEKIRNRTATSSEYFIWLFPEEISEPQVLPETVTPTQEQDLDQGLRISSIEADDLKRIEDRRLIVRKDETGDTETVNLPSIPGLPTEPKENPIITIRDENHDLLTIGKIHEAIKFVKSKVGEMYDLKGLTKDELFGLQAELQSEAKKSIPEKLDRLIDFANVYIPGWGWDTLCNSEKNTIKYTRQRDRHTASHETRNGRNSRIEELANIVLNTHRMVEANEQYRHIKCGPGEGYDGYIVERYLSEQVSSKRIPLHNRIVANDLESFIRFHEEYVVPSLSEQEIGSLDIETDYGFMKNLLSYYQKKNKLTPKKRQFAFDLMVRYIPKITMADESIKEKLSRRRLADGAQ
ncbi:hypothetical protein KY330_05340 [Candidatus Woesearchaeota archaeon]|nr:hypothetical protein [Candidatus Woesearchaeota archaeon]